MANYYTLMTAHECVPCTEDEFNALEKLADSGEFVGNLHLEYWSPGEDPADHGVYIYTEEFFDPSEVPDEFWDRLGELLKAAGKEYLELGIAFTCDKMRPESHGGTTARVYPDGQLVYADKVFDYTPKALQGVREEWKNLRDKDVWGEHPALNRHEWQRAVGEGDTNLGYWDWVWQSLEDADPE